MNDPLSQLGKILLAGGALLAAIGALLLLADRFPGLRIGRLPGDISVERGSFRFYFPLGTSIVLSIVLSAILWLLKR